jgi:glycosyltransferase involved in cell wall biosynthesis
MDTNTKVRPKIAIVAEFPVGVLEGVMSGRGGGQAATWLPQLAMQWQDLRDLDIHWCILTRDKNLTTPVKKWGQTFHFLQTPSITASLLLGRWPQRLAYRRLFRQIEPDLLHVWGTENLFGSALLEFKGPSILSMQGIIHTCFKTGDLPGWRWRLFKHWEPVSMRNASIITSESNWGLERVSEIVTGKPLRKIEYGVFPSYYDIPWNPSPDQPRILYAGGLNRLKGADILLEMLRRHPKRTWKLVVAGSGYLEQALRELNDPMVEILGTIKTPELQAKMANAWALVHPSRADTSPNVVKEARVVGLPIVGSPNGGHSEYVEHEIDGLRIESEDPDEWFKALDGLANNYPRCRQMGQIHHAAFREHFLPGNTASEFLKLYQEILIK